MFGLDNLINLLFDSAMEKLSRSERVIQTLKRLKLDPDHPPEDFTGVYQYALVEYGVGKPRPVLEIFRQSEIQQLFREALEQNNPAKLLQHGEAFLADHPLQAELQANNIDVQREFYAFAAVFIEVAKRTRTPAAILAEQKLESLHRQIATVQERLSRLPTMEGLRTEMARLATTSSLALPAGESFGAEECKAFALAQQMRGWFETLGFRFETHEIWQDDYFEWIINIPVRRGRYDRILVRGIDGEAGLRDVEALKQSVETHRTDEGWLVTARRISRVARDEVEKPENDGLGCYTLDELLDQDADFSGYLTWLEAEIQKRGIAEKYVPLACLKEDIDPDTKQRLGVSRYDDRDGWIDGYIDLWLDDPAKEHISVLGEFGTGKTWFALHYAWKALQRYREAQRRGLERPRLPLVIPLRDYAKAVSVESLFSEFFFRKHEIPIPGYSAFEQLNRMGKLLLIFDGFDEMAARVNRQEMINNFWELAKVVVPGAKVILTCRTEHFPEAKEGRALLNAELQASTRDLTGETPQFEVLELEKFNDGQIRQVLEHQAQPATVEQIMGNPQLLDLARRPVLTELILEALPDIEAGKPVDMSRVYLYAVRHKMERDIKAERTFTSMADKLYFMCELSWEMLSTDRMSINYREFPDRIRKLFGSAVEEEKDLDHWHYDMMGQTMLVRNAEGDYTPAHRSLLEFFVAYKFAAELGVITPDFADLTGSKQINSSQANIWSSFFMASKSNLNLKTSLQYRISPFEAEEIEHLRDTVGKYSLPRAVIDLIKPMLVERDEIKKTLTEILDRTRKKTEKQIGYLCGNILNLLIETDNYSLEGVDLSDCVIVGGDFSKASLKNANFRKAYFKYSLFKEALGTVLDVSFSPDDNFLAAAEASGQILIWNYSSGFLMAILEGHTNWVRSINFTSDGKRLVSGGDDRVIRFWDIEKKDCIRVMSGHIGRIRALSLSPNSKMVASAGNDNLVKLWNLETGECIHTFEGHSSWVLSIDFSKSGNYIATGGNDSQVKLWDIETGKCLRTISYHRDRVNTVCFSSDDCFLASGSSDQEIHVLDLKNHQTLCLLKGHKDSIRSICFSPDNQFLYSGGFDQEIRIWKVDEGKCVKKMTGHTSWIRTICLSSSGKLIASGGDDQTVRVWDDNSGQCIRLFQGYSHLFLSLDVDSNGKFIVSASNNSHIDFWDISTGLKQKSIQVGFTWAISVKISHSGKMLAVSSGQDRNNFIGIWDIESGNLVRKIFNKTGRIRAIQFRNNDQFLIVGGDDSTLKIWDLETGELVASLEGHKDQICSIDICQAGKNIITASEDNTVGFWNLERHDESKFLSGHTSGVWCVAFSPDGKTFASGSRDHSVRIWDATTISEVKTLKGHTDRVKAVTFSEDSKILASGSHDRKIRLWNAANGECINVLEGHENWISAIKFIPKSSLLASASEDGTIRIWDTNKASCLRIIRPVRPYEGMDISEAKGLGLIEKSTLKVLGAIEH